MGATGRYRWGGDRRSAQFVQLSESSKLKDRQRLQDRQRDRNAESYSDILGKSSSNTIKNFHDSVNLGEESSQYVRDLINPKWGDSAAYNNNCALCTMAIILRARGYDVEAMPADMIGKKFGTWRGARTAFDFDYNNFDNYVTSATPLRYVGTSVNDYMLSRQNPNKFTARQSSVINTISNTMKRWGDGSVAELSVCWKDKGAHSVSVVNIGGKISIVDGQSGQVYSSEKMINRFISRIKPGSASLLRYDNVKLKSNISDELSKMVKKK